MHHDLDAIFSKCLLNLLRPVVWMCLKRGRGLQDLIESAKRNFVDAAVEELNERGEKVTISRISAMTGVHRKDVVKIYREEALPPTAGKFASRVISQWRKDKRFLTQGRKPRVLSLDGPDCEFNQLVRSVSSDMGPKAILYDMERAGAIEITPNGAKLLVRAYVPRGNPEEGFRMLASDSQDLMRAVMDNIFCDEATLPNYHAKTQFDNLSAEDIPKIRQWLFRQCSMLQQKVDRYLMRFDLDINPNPKKTGGKRVALGIFSRTL